MFKKLLLALVAISMSSTPLLAKGDLSTRCKDLPELSLGIDAAGYKVSQKEYKLETGVCYSLVIKSTGKKEYAMQGAGFFRNMWVRKIEAGGLEIKAAPIYELEFEDESELELFFVMIKPGNYEFYAKGLKAKGTVVTFKVAR